MELFTCLRKANEPNCEACFCKYTNTSLGNSEVVCYQFILEHTIY